MVFYFSGTGNSLYVAKKLALEFEQNLVSISDSVMNARFSFTLAKDEPILFVFPIYSWAPPAIVLEFIDKMDLAGYKDNYLSVLITCGENIGTSLDVIKKRLGSKHLNSGFSVVMPSNYMILGDIETKEVQKETLAKVDARVAHIVELIRQKADAHFDVVKGPVPFVLTHVIGSLFNKFAIDAKPFYAKENCTMCGICARVCTTQIIALNDEKVVWGENCTQCLACINYCPVQAIEYGKKTQGKGRYNNPNIKVNEMYKV